MNGRVIGNVHFVGLFDLVKRLQHLYDRRRLNG